MLDEGARLFGTDGVRGRANDELTVELATDLARAAGELIRGPVLIGRDTRRSSPMLAAAVSAGLQSVGADTIDAGIVPSGAVSYLTRSTDAWFGVVVSASHNPAEDNGIKFFGSNGCKLSTELEDEIEARVRQGPPWKQPSGDLVGLARRLPDAEEQYVEFVAAQMPYTLHGVEVAIDCANGASFTAAPALLRRLKATVEVFAAEPDGTNINLDCGATHPNFLASRAAGRLGLAFDGDADRLVAVDENGVPADGDVIMAVIARQMKENDQLTDNSVVITAMANLGFRRAMGELDIDVVETEIGDRYVLEAMMERGLSLGGEQSGHIIFEDRTTGDGLVTAVRLLGVMAATGKPLSELRTVMTEYPQVLRNVRVGAKDGLEDAGSLWDAVRDVEAELGEDGRVLVRPSGTEPLIRVMVEASTRPAAAAAAERLVGVVRAELGAASF